MSLACRSARARFIAGSVVGATEIDSKDPMGHSVGTDLNTLRAMSLPAFVAYFASVGAFAGLVAWLLAFAGHLVFEISRPSWTTLLWAIVRGAILAGVVGLALRWFWRRRRGGDGENRRSEES